MRRQPDYFDWLARGGQFVMLGKKGDGNALVVVVGRSKVNCVVISKIIECMGLRALCEQPEQAAALLQRYTPSVVILDLPPADEDWSNVLLAISGAAANAGYGVPGVIALVTDKGAGRPASAMADMLVSKPITQDRLQPAIELLLSRRA